MSTPQAPISKLNKPPLTLSLIFFSLSLSPHSLSYFFSLSLSFFRFISFFLSQTKHPILIISFEILKALLHSLLFHSGPILSRHPPSSGWISIQARWPESTQNWLIASARKPKLFLRLVLRRYGIDEKRHHSHRFAILSSFDSLIRYRNRSLNQNLESQKLESHPLSLYMYTGNPVGEQCEIWTRRKKSK